MRISSIICKIKENKNGTWELLAVQEEKKITIAIKENFNDAKELAFALRALDKVNAVEFDGDFLSL